MTFRPFAFRVAKSLLHCVVLPALSRPSKTIRVPRVNVIVEDCAYVLIV